MRLPASSTAKATFSSAVRVGMRLKNWKTNPMSSLRYPLSWARGKEVISFSPTLMVPEVALSRPPARLSRVVLPEPLGPQYDHEGPFRDGEVHFFQGGNGDLTHGVKFGYLVEYDETAVVHSPSSLFC